MFKKNKYGAIIPVVVVGLFVSSTFFFNRGTIVDRPPQIPVPTVSLYQGSISGCSIPGYPYGAPEESADTEPLIGKPPLQRGAHLYHNSSDKTLKETFESIDPVEGNKVIIIHYNAEEQGFYSYPNLGSDEIAGVDDINTYTIPAYEGFIAVSCYASSTDSLGENDEADGVATSLSEVDGWVLTSALSANLSYLDSDDTEVKSVWLQQGAGGNFEDGYLENGADSVLDADTEFKMLWVKAEQKVEEEPPIDDTSDSGDSNTGSGGRGSGTILDQSNNKLCGNGQRDIGEALLCKKDCTFSKPTLERGEGSGSTEPSEEPQNIIRNLDATYRESGSKAYLTWTPYDLNEITGVKIHHATETGAPVELGDTGREYNGDPYYKNLTREGTEITNIRLGVNHFAVVAQYHDGTQGLIEFKEFDFADKRPEPPRMFKPLAFGNEYKWDEEKQKHNFVFLVFDASEVDEENTDYRLKYRVNYDIEGAGLGAIWHSAEIEKESRDTILGDIDDDYFQEPIYMIPDQTPNTLYLGDDHGPVSMHSNKYLESAWDVSGNHFKNTSKMLEVVKRTGLESDILEVLIESGEVDAVERNGVGVAYWVTVDDIQADIDAENDLTNWLDLLDSVGLLNSFIEEAKTHDELADLDTEGVLLDRRYILITRLTAGSWDSEDNFTEYDSATYSFTLSTVDSNGLESAQSVVDIEVPGNKFRNKY